VAAEYTVENRKSAIMMYWWLNWWVLMTVMPPCLQKYASGRAASNYQSQTMMNIIGLTSLFKC
jgi:hypothetical protein